MKTSIFGIKTIAKREGTVLRVYKDSQGYPTAGVGHLLTDVEKKQFPVGTPITQAQSDTWLAADLKESEDAVNSIGVKLKQNEFDALVSLTFNIGSSGFRRSTVARKLKAGDHDGAAKAILLWNKPPEIQGRRRTEYNQFLNPYSAAGSDSKTNLDQGVDSNSADLSAPANQDTSPRSVVVQKEKPSIWAKIIAIFTTVSAIGINLGTLIQQKLQELTPIQIGYLIAVLALAALAIWIYQKAAKGAQVRTLALIEKAADPTKHTVELKK